jgi:hypothetical protein
MENSYYELKEVNIRYRHTETIIEYEVVNYDGDEEKLQKMLEELNEKCMFYETFYDNSNTLNGHRIIEKDIINLD